MTTRHGSPRVPARTWTWLAFGLIAPLAAPAGAAPGPVDFAHDIVPVLKAHCVKCHTSGTYKGGFSFERARR